MLVDDFVTCGQLKTVSESFKVLIFFLEDVSYVSFVDFVCTLSHGGCTGPDITDIFVGLCPYIKPIVTRVPLQGQSA